MDNSILQVLLWVMAGGILVMLIARRRKRRAMR